MLSKKFKSHGDTDFSRAVFHEFESKVLSPKNKIWSLIFDSMNPKMDCGVLNSSILLIPPSDCCTSELSRILKTSKPNLGSKLDKFKLFVCRPSFVCLTAVLLSTRYMGELLSQLIKEQFGFTSLVKGCIKKSCSHLNLRPVAQHSSGLLHLL